MLNHRRNLFPAFNCFGLGRQKTHSVCRKWTIVQQRDESTARGGIPTELDCTTNAERAAKATVRQGILLNFDTTLFRTFRGLKIVWEILHEFETQNIPQQKIPACTGGGGGCQG